MRNLLLPAFPACWSWLPVPSQCATVDDLFAWQQGRCALCGIVPPDPLVLDHDHDSLLVRGWLCPGCNNREGRVRGGRLEERYPAVVAYRALPPAVICRMVVQYVGRGPGDTRLKFTTTPAGARPGRWCEDHRRHECVKHRNSGGDCHALPVRGLAVCKNHGGKSLARLREDGRVALGIQADQEAAMRTALAALLASRERH